MNNKNGLMLMFSSCIINCFLLTFLLIILFLEVIWETHTGNWWTNSANRNTAVEIVIRANWDIENFDPYNAVFGTSIRHGWKHWLRMTGHWTRLFFDFKPHWRPLPKYQKGYLAESWEVINRVLISRISGMEFTGRTYRLQNGREFIAGSLLYFIYNGC